MVTSAGNHRCSKQYVHEMWAVQQYDMEVDLEPEAERMMGQVVDVPDNRVDEFW